MIKNGNTYKFITDHLGSVRLVVDVATGDVAQQIEYDEFGNVTQNTNPDFQPFGFAHGLYDSQIKLVRFGVRDYDARSGRWACKDPIGFGGGVSNVFEYCLNDPVNNFDPSGLQSLVTNRQSGTTTFDPGPGNGQSYTITTRTNVTRDSQTGANGAFTTPDVTVRNDIRSNAYGPEGAYIDTGDPRGRDIHGGGSGLADPYAPQQGWVATHGCTRGQNADVQELGRRIQEFQRQHPGTPIPYTRN
jgi:RHS repeat-associated protein